MLQIRKIGLLGLGLVVLFSLSGASCNWFNKKNTTPNTNTAESLTNVDPTSIDSSLATYLQLAKTKAAEWKRDAALYYVSIKLPVSLLPALANETYVFGSASDANNWWTISIAEGSGKYLRAIIPKEDYLGNTLKPINEQYWKTNYLTAFQVAEKNGGSTFRTNNIDTEVTMNLSQGEPKGWLWWYAEYKAPSGNSQKIIINPSDKSVVDDSGNIISK